MYCAVTCGAFYELYLAGGWNEQKEMFKELGSEIVFRNVKER